MRNAYKNIILFLAVLIITSCQPKQDTEAIAKQMMEESIEAQVKRFRDKRVLTCHRLAIERAGEIVDSMLIANAKSIALVDTVTKPPKPNRPIAPPAKLMEDTQAIAPIVNETLELQQEYQIPSTNVQPKVESSPPLVQPPVETTITVPQPKPGSKIGNK